MDFESQFDVTSNMRLCMYYILYIFIPDGYKYGSQSRKVNT